MPWPFPAWFRRRMSLANWDYWSFARGSSSPPAPIRTLPEPRAPESRGRGCGQEENVRQPNSGGRSDTCVLDRQLPEPFLAETGLLRCQEENHFALRIGMRLLELKARKLP